jgi:hypothetical protein
MSQAPRSSFSRRRRTPGQAPSIRLIGKHIAQIFGFRQFFSTLRFACRLGQPIEPREGWERGQPTHGARTAGCRPFGHKIEFVFPGTGPCLRIPGSDSLYMRAEHDDRGLQGPDDVSKCRNRRISIIFNPQRRLGAVGNRRVSLILDSASFWSERGQNSYQRNQLPSTPDHKGYDQKDKEARGEQLATRMRGWRKVKTIIRKRKTIVGFARRAIRRLRCSFSAQGAHLRVGHAFVSAAPRVERSRHQKVPCS